MSHCEGFNLANGDMRCGLKFGSMPQAGAVYAGRPLRVVDTIVQPVGSCNFSKQSLAVVKGEIVTARTRPALWEVNTLPEFCNYRAADVLIEIISALKGLSQCRTPGDLRNAAF